MIRVACLAAALLLSGPSGGRTTDFSGTWKMDLRASTDLPSSFHHLAWYTMSVDQAKDSMRIDVRFQGEGRTVELPATVYRFDSSEVYRADTLRGTQRWIRSEWESTGRKLIVTSRVVQKREGDEQRYTETDVWQFGKKNMLLIVVTQKFEGTDSTHVERRYFRRAR